MKIININNFEEKLFYEKLKNNLEVFLVPLKNKKNYFISMGIKYGNSYTQFKVDDKTISVPLGIAHFLEHKLFERNDNIKPFDFFSKSGTDVNAATSINYTNYYCTGNTNYIENLKYFLNWLKKLEITDELVEKEKGIILQEAKMVSDNPDRFLYEKIRDNTFVKDSYGRTIIGTDQDILSIKKEDLEICFNSFYRPDNMFLIIVGNFNEDETIDIIKNELKDFDNPKEKIEKIKVNEPDKVLRKYEEYHKNISTPKIAISYKINKNKFKMEDYKLEIYLCMLLRLLFGSTSLFREKGLKENLFLDFNSSVNSSDTHEILIFDVISHNFDNIEEKIEQEFKNQVITEEDFNRIKKCWVAGEIKSIDSVNMTVNDIFSDIIYYGEYKNNKIDDLNNLSFKELKKVLKSIDLNNKSVVKVFPLK